MNGITTVNHFNVENNHFFYQDAEESIWQNGSSPLLCKHVFEIKIDCLTYVRLKHITASIRLLKGG